MFDLSQKQYCSHSSLTFKMTFNKKITSERREYNHQIIKLTSCFLKSVNVIFKTVIVGHFSKTKRAASLLFYLFENKRMK